MTVPLEAPHAQLEGMIGGKYRVGRTIAVGGMGVVYEATNVRTNGKVALKVLSEEAKRDDASRIRFAREARASGRLRSRHVARVLDVDTLDDKTPYIVMELLDGNDLSREIKDRPPLPLDEVASIVVQVAAGVAEAHAAGIVHRDLKPGNVFLATEGTQRIAKVLDFGISKVPVEGEDENELTRTFATVGTPAYMSPEQIRRPRDVDSATDVWSLGVLAYRLLAGKVPFTGNASSVAVSICNDVPLPLSTIRDDVPASVSALIDAALSKDKTQRPTIAAFAEGLSPHLGDGPSASIAREALAEIHRLAGSTPLPANKASLAASIAIAVEPAPARRMPLLAVVALVAAVIALGTFLLVRAGGGATEVPTAGAGAGTGTGTGAGTAAGTGTGTGTATVAGTGTGSGTVAAIGSGSGTVGGTGTGAASASGAGAKPGVVYAPPPKAKPTIHATASAAPLPPRL